MTPQTAAALRALEQEMRTSVWSDTPTIAEWTERLAAVLTQEGAEVVEPIDPSLMERLQHAGLYGPECDWCGQRQHEEPAAAAAQSEPRAAEGAGKDEMLRCPFCHSANTGIASDDPQETTGYVKCHACGARGPVACDNEAIVASWNRATAADAVASELVADLVNDAYFLEAIDGHLPRTPWQRNCVSRIREAAKILSNTPTAAAATPAGGDRTPADYAIEFGGYLADAAKEYIETREAYDSALDDEGGPPDGLRDSLTDHWRALQESIYAFRSRADLAKRMRAAISTPPAAQAQDAGPK